MVVASCFVVLLLLDRLPDAVVEAAEVVDVVLLQALVDLLVGVVEASPDEDNYEVGDGSDHPQHLAEQVAPPVHGLEIALSRGPSSLVAAAAVHDVLGRQGGLGLLVSVQKC